MKKSLTQQLEEARIEIKNLTALNQNAERVASDLLKLDEAQRKEFSIAFGYEIEKSQYEYGIHRNVATSPLSWSQIFVNLGKLIAKRDFVNGTDQLTDMDRRLNDLEQRDIGEEVRVHRRFPRG